MHYLALDVGSKYIGMALADSDLLIASPWKTIQVIKRNFQRAVLQIQSEVLRAGYKIEVCIIGYPLNMNLTKSQTTLMVEQFATIFQKIFKSVYVVYADEQQTTMQANELLFAMDLKSSVRNKNLDRVSAAIILQNYLDANLRHLKILNCSIANKIAVMRAANLQFLKDYLLKKPTIKNILEIGTGCGYSAQILSEIKTVESITTIEKDQKRFEVAKELLKDNSKVKLVHVDVNDFNVNNFYDLIILDGPKKQLVQLFKKFEKFLTKHGAIVIDNLYLKNVYDQYKISNEKRLLPLLQANQELHVFLEKLMVNKYQIWFDESGDGLAIIEGK